MPLAAAALIKSGGAIAQGVMNARANKRAAAAERSAQGEQLAYLREQSAADERRYQQQQAVEQARWEAEQGRMAQQSARLDPFRAAASNLITRRMTGGVPGPQPAPNGTTIGDLLRRRY